MSHQGFGGEWTADKLDRLRKYLEAYTIIFSRNPKAQMLQTTYVDAFAGTGYRKRDASETGQTPLFPELEEPEAQDFLKGSPRIALELANPFHKYLFIERDPDRAKELEKLKQDFPAKADAISIVQGDANTELRKWVSATDWKQNRAVVFLDPFGMQVEWSLIETLGRTQAVDLWLLFPLGVAVNRLLPRGKQPPKGWARALDRMLGTQDWRGAFYRTGTQPSLFGDKEVQARQATIEAVGRFFVERLKTIFSRVADRPHPLYNSRNVPIFMLCFAAGNPKGAPTAVKIAQDILLR
jgi:three-Cys-motif partner protein